MPGPDYQQPMDGSLFWVYEGMTQYLGARAAGASRAAFARELPRDARQHRRLLRNARRGNRWRPLADTAVAAQILYGTPAAWSSSRRGSGFYEASEFLWLNVDAELRARSGGRASIETS